MLQYLCISLQFIRDFLIVADHMPSFSLVCHLVKEILCFVVYWCAYGQISGSGLRWPVIFKYYNKLGICGSFTCPLPLPSRAGGSVKQNHAILPLTTHLDRGRLRKEISEKVRNNWRKTFFAYILWALCVRNLEFSILKPRPQISFIKVIASS